MRLEEPQTLPFKATDYFRVQLSYEGGDRSFFRFTLAKFSSFVGEDWADRCRFRSLAGISGFRIKQHKKVLADAP